MLEPALKCENNCAIFKQNDIEKLFISFKYPIWLEGQSRISRFPPKKNYNIN